MCVPTNGKYIDVGGYEWWFRNGIITHMKTTDGYKFLYKNGKLYFRGGPDGMVFYYDDCRAYTEEEYKEHLLISYLAGL